MARVSRHLCPILLAEELAELRLTPEIYVSRLEPREPELILQQLAVRLKDCSPRMLRNDYVFEL